MVTVNSRGLVYLVYHQLHRLPSDALDRALRCEEAVVHQYLRRAAAICENQVAVSIGGDLEFQITIRIKQRQRDADNCPGRRTGDADRLPNHRALHAVAHAAWDARWPQPVSTSEPSVAMNATRHQLLLRRSCRSVKPASVGRVSQQRFQVRVLPVCRLLQPWAISTDTPR